MKKYFVLLALVLFVPVVSADVWDGVITLKQSYSCLGMDGVPIGSWTALADQCCTVGSSGSNGELIPNAPDHCRAGFNTISADAGSGAAAGINLAQQSLTVSQGLGGNTTNPTGPLTNVGGSNASPGSESIASVAGGGSTNGEGSGAGAGSGSGGPGGNSNSGSGVGGAGSGGSGLTLGSAGGTSGLKNSGDDANGDKANGGGYVKSGGAGGKTGGSGSGIGGMFGGLFGGSGGSGAGGVGAGGANELAFGDSANGAGGADGNGSDEDGDGRGTSEDPSDYFNRIDKSANIFKIVSARYMKKKSLWKTIQKESEDLKQKKI